jgi:hypothetical protein
MRVCQVSYKHVLLITKFRYTLSDSAFGWGVKLPARLDRGLPGSVDSCAGVTAPGQVGPRYTIVQRGCTFGA